MSAITQYTGTHPKQFAQEAIKNGYGTGEICAGWNWIRENIGLLDAIFQSPEYKAKNGMKYLCMPLILGNTEYTKQEEDALGTAWYINNQRETSRRKEEYKNKMIEQGWLLLTSEAIKTAFNNKKRLHISGHVDGDIFSSHIDNVLKPFVDNEGRACLMKPKATRRGIIFHGQGDQSQWFYKEVK